LVRLRGQWVELDRERLREVLAHWERVRHEAEHGGLPFLEGMRLLAGAGRSDAEASALAAADDWSRVEAGTWLARTLEGLRGPGGLAAADPGADLRGTLRPYQKTGVAWLAFASSLRLGVCLADDMGLGKTIQVLALLLLRKRRARSGEPPHLLVAPGVAPRQLAGGDRALRSVVDHADRPPLGDAGARAGRPGGRPSRRYRPRHHHLRHAGAHLCMRAPTSGNMTGPAGRVSVRVGPLR
jgi:hypothetical protein